jgi:Fe-S oxidoreductase
METTNRNANRYPDIEKCIEGIQSRCTRCCVCQTQCAFLRKYGSPGHIIDTWDFGRPDHQAIAYECSLCGLCGAVCPENIDVSALFLAIRRRAVEEGNIDLSKYRTILGYEKRGTSSLFSYYGLPTGCDTVFFPGCTLPGTRPETTWQLFEYMQRHIPGLGIVMDCCTKPSHDLGRQRYAVAVFEEMCRFLTTNGVRSVLVACPNCHKMFRQYGGDLAVQTVYELMDAHGLPSGASAAGELSVHDPCPLRMETDVQDAVRRILSRMGISVLEMKHRRKRTLCCGEGGSVAFTNPDLAKAWGAVRQREAEGMRLATYCAGCSGYLGRVTTTLHVADLIFDPEASMNGGPRVSSSPMTYFNRIRLKRRFKSTLKPATERVRPSLRGLLRP